MPIWIFNMIQKKFSCISLSLLFLASCTTWVARGQGQVIFHWEKENTGVEKFARDHSECLREAEDFTLIPNIKSWFYSEEVKMDLRADWHAKKGIWASYVPYPGAQPLVVNSLRDDTRINPMNYRICMEKRGYWHRRYNIPTTTNIFIYKPQRRLQNVPFSNEEI